MNTRLLMRAILYAAKSEADMEKFVCDNPLTECAYYPGSKKLVIINNTGDVQKANVVTTDGVVTATIDPYDIYIN